MKADAFAFRGLSRFSSLENKLLLKRIAVVAPKADIAKSLIAILGAFMRAFVAPAKSKEAPNKNANRLKNRET